MAYFDNAATTYPKPEQVYTFMDSFYRANGGNAGRGSYELAINSKSIIDDTRKRIQDLLHCPAKQVVFTPTATIALNMIIQGVIATGKRNIYISPFEHNAVTRVLHHYEKSGQIRVTELAVDSSLDYNFDKIQYQFDDVAPDFVIVSHASNVIGLISPVETICSLAKKYKATTLVDMAQTAGLVDLDVGLETIDFAVFAGHKTLLGPTGIAGFVMKTTIKLEPVLFGGTGYDSSNPDMPESIPEKFEMGTLNIVGVAGLNAALQWIEKAGVSELYEKELQNRAKLLSLLDKYDYIKIIGNVENHRYVGIVSCLFDGISSESLGPILSEYGISARTGLHCAPNAHRFLGTFPSGTVRFSISVMTKEEDFVALEEALNSIQSEM